LCIKRGEKAATPPPPPFAKKPPLEKKEQKLPSIKTHAAQCILVVVHNSISPLNPLTVY
jgi:hypothetical protein